MKRKSLLIIMAAVFLVTAAAGCGSEGSGATTTSPVPTTSAPVTSPPQTTSPVPTTGTAPTTTISPTLQNRIITNWNGSPLVVPSQVQRVAALYGPSYEKVVMLGAEDKIVMCFGNHKNTWPWSAKVYKRLSAVQATTGTINQPNMEELLKANPDVVFYWDFLDPVKKIQEVGLPAVYPGSSFKLSDAKDSLNVYAAAMGGAAPAKAEAYAKYFDEKVKMVSDITSKIPEDKRPSVYFAVRNLLQANGKGTNVPELVKLAGGVLINADVEGGFGVAVTMEQLLKWDPAFIFIDQAAATLVGSKPAEQIVAETTNDARYKNLSAVTNSHIYVSPTGVFFWNAGQQVILQLVWIAKTLHPEEFAAVDMVALLKDFYSRFYDYKLTDAEAQAILLHQNPS